MDSLIKGLGAIAFTLFLFVFPIVATLGLVTDYIHPVFMAFSILAFFWEVVGIATAIYKEVAN